LEKTLTGVGSNPYGSSRDDSDVSHVVGVHDQGADESLVFGVVFANINLLALLRRAARVHDKAPRHDRRTPLRRMATMGVGPIRVRAAGNDTELDPSEGIALTSRDDEALFYLFRVLGKGNAASDRSNPEATAMKPSETRSVRRATDCGSW
jgi:hypothetical protein